MRRLLLCLLVAAGFGISAAQPSEAKRILRDGPVAAHVVDGDWCEQRVYVELRAPTPDIFGDSAFQVRRVVAILATMLPLDCPQVRHMDLVGSVSGAAVWRATASTAAGDIRVLEPPQKAHLVPLAQRQRTTEIQHALNALGYNSGYPDGVLGPQTRAAIETFLEERGEDPANLGSAQLLMALRNEMDPTLTLAGDEAEAAEPPVMASSWAESGAAGTVLPPSELQRLAVAYDLIVAEQSVAVAGGAAPPDYLELSNLAPVLDRLALRAAPEIAANDTTALELFGLLPLELRRELVQRAVSELTAYQFRRLEERQWRLTRQDAADAGLNEFEVQRILQSFRARGQERLIGQAPELPLPVLVICSAQLGEYDFEQQRFEIMGLETCDHMATGTDRVAGSFATADLPRYLSLASEEGEQLGDRLGSDRRMLIGISAEIRGIRPQNEDGNRFDLVIERESFRLYEDSSLQSALMEVELEEDPAPTLSGETVDPRRLVISNDRYSRKPGNRQLPRYLDLLALSVMPEMLENERVAYHYIELLSESQQQRLAERAGLDHESTFRRDRPVEAIAHGVLDEFERRRLLQVFRREFAASLVALAPKLPMPILLRCDIGVEDYDFERLLFPFERDLERVCGRLSLLDNSRYTAPIPLSDAPEGVVAPLDDAPAFKDAHLVETREVGRMVSRSSPMARLGIELAITEVRRGNRSRVDEPSFDVAVDVEGIVLFSAADPAQAAPIQRLNFGAEQQVYDTTSPGREPVIGELPTLLLLMLKKGLFTPTQEQWRKWAEAVAGLEDGPGAAAWSDFFSKGRRRGEAAQNDSSAFDEATLQRFQAWMRARASELPDTLSLRTPSLEVDEDSRKAGKLALLHRTSHPTAPELAEAAGVPRKNVYVMQVNDSPAFPKPLSAVALILPEEASSFSIAFDPQAVDEGTEVEGRLSLRIANARLMPRDKDKVLVVDVAPLSGSLLSKESGEALAVSHFHDEKDAEVAVIDFPPESYIAVLYSDLTGRDPVNTVYEALDYRLDAFERRQRAEQLVAAAQQYKVGDEGFWIVGEVELSEYDFDREVFPVRTLVLQEFARSYATAVTLFPVERSRLEIHMTPEEARDWQRQNLTHPKYAVRVRALPEEVQGKTLRIKVLEYEVLHPEAMASIREPARVLYSRIFEEAEVAENAETEAAEEAQPTPNGSMPRHAVLGVSLGQDTNDAIRSLTAELEEPEVFWTNRAERAGLRRSNLWEPFNHGVMVRSGDGSDAIALFSEPPFAGGEVTAVTRWVDMSGSGPPMAVVADLLVERYGRATAYHENENAIFMAWYDDTNLPDYGSCTTDLALLARREWRVDDLPWYGSEREMELPREAALHPGGPGYNIQSEGAYPFTAEGLIARSNLSKCPETLFALVVAGSDGRAERILSGITDPLAVVAISEANRRVMISGVNDANPATVDLKF